MATTGKSSSSGLSDETLRRIHQNWMRRYDRKYADEEEEDQRFKIFKATYEDIEKHNTEEETRLIFLSPYSDLTDEEFLALYSTDLQGKQLEDMMDDVILRRRRRPRVCDGCCKRLCKSGRKS